MVEHTPFGSQNPDLNRYSEDPYRDESGSSRQRRYAFGRSAKDEYAGGDSVPLFLSDPDGEPDPSEYDYDYEGADAPRPRMSLSLKILVAVVAAAGVAMLFAMATSDATRDVIMSAKASFAGTQAVPTASAATSQEALSPPQSATRLTATDVQVKDPGRWAAPGTAQTTPIVRGPVVATAPARDDISSAYQNAVQSRAAPPAPVAPSAVAAPPPPVAPVAVAPAAITPSAVTPSAAPSPARVIAPEELALLMKRAKEMLNAGDIPVARLLLRRAADAQDPTAALMLAQTYDPDVLGTQDTRNITPDPEAARAWYQKAAQLGSADAQRRLAQMQN